jgi:hypothetical protein
MSVGPKDKSETAAVDRGSALRSPVARASVSPDSVSLDSVSLIVAIALVALGAGGILAVFSGPLAALVTH